MNKMTILYSSLFEIHKERITSTLIQRVCLLFLFITPFQLSYGFELPAFPNADLVLSAEENRQNHPVIISRMKRVNGVVTSDGAQWLDGHLRRALYLLPPGHSSSQGYNFYINQFRDLGVEGLFECRSFSCGASNFWANDIFDISILYGQDKAQFFYIGKKQGNYYSVYSVRRGNGRVYTLVDIFQPDGNKNKPASEQRAFRGIVKLPLNDGLTKSPDLQSFIEEMNSDLAMNALFIIHSPVPDTLAELDIWQQKMEELKSSIKKHLNDQGVNDSRLRFNISAGASGGAIGQEGLESLYLGIVPLN